MRRGSYDDAAASIRPHLRSLAQRRRSAPSLVLGRALGMPWNSIREEEPVVAVEQCAFVLGLSADGAPLLLDESAQLTEGQKTRERHLFLFNRELIIAKLKSTASYRLKHRLSLEELWLYSCDEDEEDEEEEDAERMDFDLKTSFVLVWPTAFCVVTFRSPEVKGRWVETLNRKISEAQERSASSSPPLGFLMKVLSGNIMTKTLTGGGTEADMDSPPEGNAIGPAPQWPLCNREEAAKQPIAGHGSSQASKLGQLITRKLRRSSTHSGPSGSKRKLFGQALSKICLEDGSLPQPITEILRLLWKNGPATEGVFRKPGNTGKLNVLRDELNKGQEVDLEAQQVLLLVGLLKSFLKDLPGSLLMDEKYDDWVGVMDKEDEDERVTEIKSVIETLPRPHVELLQRLLCVLHHISQNAQQNKMDACNLAVCIAPSLFHRMDSPVHTHGGQLQTEELKRVTQKVTGLTQFLIERCTHVFGEELLTLFGDPEEEELADTSDSMSSHQHDSAYDSGDAGLASECDCRPNVTATARRKEHTMVTSCSSDAIFSPFTNPLDRRCSEPAIFPLGVATSTHSHAPAQGLARSHDDCSAHAHSHAHLTHDFLELKKQTSDDSFLRLRQAERRLAQEEMRRLGGSLVMDPPLRGASVGPVSSSSRADRDRDRDRDRDCDRRTSTTSRDYSSSCSLESAASNVSEGSVFTSSPLGSPSSSRRPMSISTKPKGAPSAGCTSSSSSSSFTSTSRSQSVSVLSKQPPSLSEVQLRAEGEGEAAVVVKRRSQSMRAKGLGSIFNRGSTKRPEAAQKDAAPAFPCGTLQEDSQSEVTETTMMPTAEVTAVSSGSDLIRHPVHRQRPLSAIEVFQHVDSQQPGKPPSYEQALLSSAQPAPPQYRRSTAAMTVHAAREHRSRPVSMNEGFLLNPSSYSLSGRDAAARLSDIFPSPLSAASFASPEAVAAPVPFRARAMSESVSRTKDTVARRCSQPLFEELSYSKESYV